MADEAVGVFLRLRLAVSGGDGAEDEDSLAEGDVSDEDFLLR